MIKFLGHIEILLLNMLKFLKIPGFFLKILGFFRFFFTKISDFAMFFQVSRNSGNPRNFFQVFQISWLLIILHQNLQNKLKVKFVNITHVIRLKC